MQSSIHLVLNRKLSVVHATYDYINLLYNKLVQEKQYAPAYSYNSVIGRKYVFKISAVRYVIQSNKCTNLIVYQR